MNRTVDGKTRKSIRRKVWWSNNFLGVIMTLMIAAYFSVDLYEKQEERNYRTINTKEHIVFDNKLYTVSLILINDPNTDAMLRDILTDYVKEYNKTRGGS